jgi:hypothetical protein
MLNVANNTFLLSVVIVNVVMLSVMAPLNYLSFSGKFFKSDLCVIYNFCCNQTDKYVI